MKESTRLQSQMSEYRQKLNALESQEGEYPADEIAGTMKQYEQCELRYRSALIQENHEEEQASDSDLPGDLIETRNISQRLEMRHYVHSALNETPLTGAEAEYNVAKSLTGAGVQIPWAALLSEEQRLEVRAATSAPDNADVNVNQILGRIFADGAGAFLGVMSPSVPAGASSYPVLSSGVEPAYAASGANANQTAATLTPNNLKPERLTAEYLIDLSDINEFGMMEDALRTDLSGAMSEARDKAILSSAANPEGFNSALTAADNPTAVSTFESYAAARPGLVDGRYAHSANDVRIVVGADTYSHAASLFQTGSGTSAISQLAAMVSPHLPAKNNSNIQRAIASRSQGRAVAPMWPSISLIRDSISVASTGRLKLIAIALWAFKVLDTDGFASLKFKLA